MKAFYCLLFIFFYPTVLISQKVDLDKYFIKVAYLQLPSNQLPVEYSTFSTKFIANGINLYDVGYMNREGDLESIYFTISGFKKVKTGGHLSIKIQIDGYDMGKPEIVKKEDKSKDKDGKETISTSYKLTFKYLVPMRYTIADLNGVIIQDGSLAEGTSTKTYESGAYTTTTALENYWKENGITIKRSLIRSFMSEKLSAFEIKLNNEIGYTPRTIDEILWSTDSPKHPENEQFRKVCDDVKIAMGEMTSEKSLSLEKVKPAIEYFEAILKKYTKDEKPERKLRYASWFNMATIYYWLEDFDNAIRCCDGLVANDYDKSDAKDIKQNSERMKKILSGPIKSAHYVRDVSNAIAPPLTPFQVEEENIRLSNISHNNVPPQPASNNIKASSRATTRTRIRRTGMVDLDNTIKDLRSSLNSISELIASKETTKKTTIVFDESLTALIISMDESLVNFQLMSNSLSMDNCFLNSSLFLKTQVENFQLKFNSFKGNLDKESVSKMKSLLKTYEELTSKNVMTADMTSSNSEKKYKLLIEPYEQLNDMTYDCLDLILDNNQQTGNILMSLAQVQTMLNYGTSKLFKDDSCSNQAYNLAKEDYARLKALGVSARLSTELMEDFNQLVNAYSTLFRSDKNVMRDPENIALIESINQKNYPSFILKLLQSQ